MIHLDNWKVVDAVVEVLIHRMELLKVAIDIEMESRLALVVVVLDYRRIGFEDHQSI